MKEGREKKESHQKGARRRNEMKKGRKDRK
jgi:hypothetical protein